MKLKDYKADILILVPVLLLIMFSVGVVYSASSDYSLAKWGDPNKLFFQHLVRVVISVFMIFLFAKIDYSFYQIHGKKIIWISLIILFLIFFIGISVKNVNRWIAFGPLTFQPSEFAKFALVIYLSVLFVRKKSHLDSLYKGYLPVLFYIISVSILIAVQPNFSTAVIIFSTAVIMMLVSPIRIKHLIITIISLVPFAVFFILTRSYIRARIENFADYTSGGNAQHQLTQALIGLGNGGFWGVGAGNSIQKQFFLPESYGDFIFSIIGEEYGFVGTFIIIMIFCVLLIRGYAVSKFVNDEFGKYLSFGITTMLVLYAVVNISVSCGIFPTTGVPFPFLSYGGTALIFNSIAVGILLNISSNKNNGEEFNNVRNIKKVI